MLSRQRVWDARIIDGGPLVLSRVACSGEVVGGMGGGWRVEGGCGLGALVGELDNI